MEKWFIKNKKADFKKMSQKLNVSQVLCKLLVNRGVKNLNDALNFIRPNLKGLHDPKMMKDMVTSADIIDGKIKDGKKIRIVGDFDVDGIVSTFILYSGLKECGADVDYEIPDRILDGYGINGRIIKSAKDDGIDTILTCDNGISAANEISTAKKLGLTCIITDHHNIPFYIDKDGKKVSIIPPADAVIDPKQPDCKYPFKDLCGAEVAYKFMEIMYEKALKPAGYADKFIEYAAIAAVCDIVDLLGENRTIVKEGLKRINETQNLGLKALVNGTGLEGKKISTYHLGFIIGPCLNASGRLDSAKVGLKLLLAEDKEEACMFAAKLCRLNDERKRMTQKGVDEVIDIIENTGLKKDKVIVAYDNNIHESIAGIIAGRIKEKYNVPTIVLTDCKDGAKGSGRSISEYNMFEELTKCRDILTKFGGHSMAAGLSLKKENIEKLRQRLNDAANLSSDDIAYKIHIDMSIPFKYISTSLADEISILEPFGKGNPKPLFAQKGVQVLKVNVLGKDNNVLKLKLKSDNCFMEAIMFDKIDEFIKLFENIKIHFTVIKMDFVFTIGIDEFMGKKNLQLQIVSFRRTV